MRADSGQEIGNGSTTEATLRKDGGPGAHCGRGRPQWMWAALSGGRLVARAAWRGSRGGAAAPSLLDILDVTDVSEGIDAGVHLLDAALDEIIPPGARPPEYIRLIPPDWREQASLQRKGA